MPIFKSNFESINFDNSQFISRFTFTHNFCLTTCKPCVDSIRSLFTRFLKATKCSMRTLCCYFSYLRQNAKSQIVKFFKIKITFAHFEIVSYYEYHLKFHRYSPSNCSNTNLLYIHHQYLNTRVQTKNHTKYYFIFFSKIPNRN